jgi:hypothetical protein
MSASTVVVRGRVKPDGTLELEGTPELPIGPVEVVVRALPQPSTTEGMDWWQYIQAARKELEAMNYPFMNEQEVSAWVEELRADDDRIEQAYRQAEKASGRPESR